MSSSMNAPTRITFACIRCAERKVKCDRQRPCSACTKHNAECVFNALKPTRKRQKRVKVQALADRLNQYEALLQEHGIDTRQLPESTASGLPSHTPSTQNDPSSIPPLPVGTTSGDKPTGSTTLNITGRFKFVENSLWNRMAEEADDPENAFDDPDDSSDTDNWNDGHDFVLTSLHQSSHKRQLHPTSAILLWHIFEKNVDPLTKIVHVPTLRPAFLKAANDTSRTIPRAFEALMFAIYATAMMSLKDDECLVRFTEAQKSLLSRYIRASERALARARFMGTTNLTVLQALCLHLLAARDVYEPRALYALNGVAVRAAQLMGLERDGSFLGLGPFETELRRRIWWQIKTHDSRTAELCGLAKFRDLEMGAESTKWPTNVDDDQLYPSMTSLNAMENKVTDFLFVAFRCEMMEFAVGRIARFRKQGLDAARWNLDETRHGHNKGEMETALKELQEKLETRYLRYCDPSQPLHLLTMLVGRYGMNVITFLIHHPRSWAASRQVSASERQLVWDVSVKLLEQHNMVQSNEMLQPFSWHATYFRQWHAFIHVLDTLRADPLREDASKVWGLITSSYENTPAMTADMKKPIHVAIGTLCLKAYAARETAFRSNSMYFPPTPAFILKLRQWREREKAKRQNRLAKAKRSTDLAHQNAGGTLDSEPPTTATLASHPPEINAATGDALVCSSERSQLNLMSMVNQSNSFDGFEYDQVDSSAMDFDFMLPEGYSMEDNSLEPINWEQWDSWLADSNVMR